MILDIVALYIMPYILLLLYAHYKILKPKWKKNALNHKND